MWMIIIKIRCFRQVSGANKIDFPQNKKSTWSQSGDGLQSLTKHQFISLFLSALNLMSEKANHEIITGPRERNSVFTTDKIRR